MAINGLPPHLSEEDVPEAKAEWRHQWLYSAIPVGVRWGHGPYEFPLVPYLTGFCRNCGRGFSQRIDFLENGEYIETPMGIPQTGCVGPQGI